MNDAPDDPSGGKRALVSRGVSAQWCARQVRLAVDRNPALHLDVPIYDSSSHVATMDVMGRSVAPHCWYGPTPRGIGGKQIPSRWRLRARRRWLDRLESEVEQELASHVQSFVGMTRPIFHAWSWWRDFPAPGHPSRGELREFQSGDPLYGFRLYVAADGGKPDVLRAGDAGMPRAIVRMDPIGRLRRLLPLLRDRACLRILARVERWIAALSREER
jgi:hypothetical protein